MKRFWPTFWTTRGLALAPGLASCLMLCTMLALAGVAFAQTQAPATTQTSATAAQEILQTPAIEQLSELARLAPSRQMGQPGSEAIDRWVRERFVDTAARHNPPDRYAAAQALLEQVSLKQNELNQIRNDVAIPAQQLQDALSPVYIHLTLERPKPTALAAFAVVLMCLIAYLVQKRKGVLVMGVIALIIAVGLPIAAALVVTPYEQALRSSRGDTQDGTQAELAARELHELSLKAAQSLQGLWQTGQITYPAAVYHPGVAHLAGPAGRARLYQLAPNLVDPGNLPDLRFQGPIRYVGSASIDELSQVDVRDAVVLMEFDTYNRWIDVVQLGAKAIIFLEPENSQAMNTTQAIEKTTLAPLTLARFYMPRSAIAQAFGEAGLAGLTGKDANATVTITQDQPGVWQAKEASIDWLFIPAADDSKLTAADKPQQLVHIQAYKDTNSIVPELSPGVTSIANLVALSRLVAQFELNPPDRPVLITAINSHTQGLQGEAEFAHFAFAEPQVLLEEQQLNETQLARQLFFAELHDVEGRPLSDQRIEYMRTATPVVAGQVIKANKTVLDVLRITRNDLRDRRHAAVLDLDRNQDKWTPQQIEENHKTVATIDERARVVVKFMRLFNRFGNQTQFSDLTEEENAELRDIFASISASAKVKAAQLQRAHQRITNNLALRRQLMTVAAPQTLADMNPQATAAQVFASMHPPLPATLIVGLDLTFDNDQVGFFASDGIFRWKSEAETLQRVSRLARYTLEVAADYAQKNNQANLLEDTIRNVGGVTWETYLGTRLAFGSRLYHFHTLPALTLTTLHDARTRTFTPSDTLENINAENFARVMSFTQGYLPQLVDAPALHQMRRSVGKADSLSVELNIRQQDEFSVSVPQKPVPDALVVVWGLFVPTQGIFPILGDVRPYLILMTDDRGVALARSGSVRDSSVSIYRYDPSYSRVLSSLDMGEGSKRFSPIIKPSAGEWFVSRTYVAFDSKKVDLVGLTEPLLLSPIAELEVLDAAQDARPRHFGSSGVPAVAGIPLIPQNKDGVASIFIEPTSDFKVRAGQGLIINTTPQDPTGAGFPASIGLVRDTVSTSARDMWRLTANRLELLESKGVSNDTAVDFNNDAQANLEEAQAAQEAGKNEQHLVQAEQARGLAYRAYTRGLNTINDLIKAVVIFLAMVIPFCFFLTKLISPYTDVNRQISLFAFVFVAMAVLLWLVHPAFKIAATPAVVILAFIIMGLAVFVAGVLMSRFNASMNQAVEESLGSESADAPQGRLMGVAFMVGINNMKRRRIRTTLTCVTIVLVTFTMLSVISVGQDVEPARVRVAPDTPYSGLLFTRSGLSEIDPTQMRRLRAHFEQDNAQVVSRVWVQRKGIYGDYLAFDVKPVTPQDGASAPALQAKVLLGLDVIEDGFTGAMPLAPGGRWFSSNSAREIILSVQGAALLGITPENFRNQELIINGQRLTLVGLLNDERFAKMRDLADLPLTPLLSQATFEQAAAAETAQATGQEALDASGDIMSAPGIEPARPMDIAMIPFDLAREMGGSSMHTLSVKYASPDPDTNPSLASQTTIEAARGFIRYQHARLYVGMEHPITLASTGRSLEAGQYSMTSSSSTQVGGILKVAIPIILAATIILNTMLGSVMERRREVSIYNAIGLNPGHVMVFFLAESLVFGMIGAVAGYLIGQVLSMAITYFGIVSLNLNYSSLSVMVVIFLTIATVLLSTIYPAMMAARAAVPSGQRRWALPQPQGNEIYVQFPFCYDATRVKGVCAYLREFMQQNSEASTGQFLAKIGPVGTVPSTLVDADGKAAQASDKSAGKADGQVAVDEPNYAMIFDIAPAPFDLGVNQKMEIYAYYDPHVKAHMLAVYLTRTSGEMSNWKTVNQPFLETLRKRLLGWRSQKPETHQAYYRQGEQLFAHAAPLPVLAGNSSADTSTGGR